MISGRMSDKISSCVDAFAAPCRPLSAASLPRMASIWSTPASIPPAKSPCRNFGRDDRVEDGARSRIRERSFRAIPRFDAQLALLGSDEQERPVVLVLLPDSPGAKELVRIILDRKLPERGHGRDHDLIRRLVLIGLELCLDTLARVGRKEVRGIDHAPRQRRESRVGGDRRCGQKPCASRERRGEHRSAQGANDDRCEHPHATVRTSLAAASRPLPTR